MRRQRRNPVMFTLFVILMTVLSACGGAAATSTSAPAAPSAAASAAAAASARPSAVVTSSAAASAVANLATPATSAGESGGTLTGAFDVGPGGSPQGFNPMIQGAGFLWTEKYFSKLVLYDVGFTKIQGELAESWEISPDAQTFTFKLRKGVLWHDGKPFTSEDAKFSIELFKNPESTSPYAPKYTDITEITTPDPQTVVIKTGKPNAALLDAMTFVFMFPKHHLGSIAPKDIVKNTWWTTAPVGTGPFKWSKYVPDQYVELVANETYWRGKPKLEKLINRYFKEPGSALIALQRGEIQFVYVTADESEIVKKDPNLTLIPGPSQVINYIQFNLKDPRLSDVRVRQAFMYAIDRTAIVDQLFKGTAVVVPCVFDNKTYIPSSGLTDYKRDVAKAKSLLADAKWDQIKGEPIEMLTYYTDQLSNDILVTMQQQLAEVGISIKIRSVDVPTFNGLVAKAAPEFTAYYAGAANGADPDVTSIYFLSTATPPGGANRGFYSNAEVDKAYLAGRAEPDPAKRAAAYQAACKQLNADVPWAPMWVSTRFGAVSKKVGNFVYTPSAGSGKYYDQSELWTVTK
jgi:peptide/nickel transport system substrate-binding protein